MSIEKKCSNCMNYQEIDDEDYSNCIGGSHYERPCVENNLMFFRPSEKAIREDERKLVLEKVFETMRKCDSYYGNDIDDCITWIKNEFDIKEE